MSSKKMEVAIECTLWLNTDGSIELYHEELDSEVPTLKFTLKELVEEQLSYAGVSWGNVDTEQLEDLLNTLKECTKLVKNSLK